MTFTKLFSSITESTIWRESDHTRIVWITMLAMANKNGFVFASVPGLADRARVPLEAAVMALERFQQPDEWSRTKEFEGRRIEPVDGGWRLLNYHKHRAIWDEEDRREYHREYMRKYRRECGVKNVKECEPCKGPLKEAEADSRSISIKVKVSGASRIPENFIPKDEHYSIAAELGVNCEMEFIKFRDYFLGLSGSKAVKRDWDATLRNWLRNSVNFGGRSSGQEPSKTKQRISENRRNILIGLGISPNVGSVRAGNGAGSPAGGDPTMVRDVQGCEPGNPRSSLQELLESRKVLPKAR